MLKAMFVLTALIAVARLCVAQQQLVGAVVSKSGAPIPGVRVSSSRLVFAETNKKGEFSLRWFPGQKVVGFQKLGYMPLLKVIAEGQTQVPVEMERDDNSAWHPPECLEEREARIGGGPLRFLPPKDAKVDKRRDVDYLEWVVTSKKESRHWMEIWWGPSVSGGSPHDDLITSSAVFKGRALIGTKFQLGIDFRGRSSDGTLWRWTGGFGQFVEYRNAPAEIAAYFDKIFDSACIANKITKNSR